MDPLRGKLKEERFWKDVGSIVDRARNGYMLCVPGNLNDWLGDRLRASITGGFGVPGENRNGRRVIDFCAEKGLCVGNAYFKHESLAKYTRGLEAKITEVISTIDLGIVKKSCATVRVGFEDRPLRS